MNKFIKRPANAVKNIASDLPAHPIPPSPLRILDHIPLIPIDHRSPVIGIQPLKAAPIGGMDMAVDEEPGMIPVDQL